MSKVKEMLLLKKESEFEQDLSYQEWLRTNFKEPSESELDKMEQECMKRSCFNKTNSIITHKSLNNINYKPSYGA